MPFATAFSISWRLWVLTKVTPPGATRPLQGFAIAGAIDDSNVTHYLLADQHGGLPPRWVTEADVIRAEYRREGT